MIKDLPFLKETKYLDMQISQLQKSDTDIIVSSI